MSRYRIYEPCRHCEGRGEWHGFLTNDPSERAQWHHCFDCNGSGKGREHIKHEEDDDECV